MELKKKLIRYEIVRLNLLEQCQSKFAPIKNSVILVQKVAKLKFLYASLSSTCKNYYETNHVPSSSFEKQIHKLNDDELKAQIEHFNYNFETIIAECNKFYSLSEYSIEMCDNFLVDLLTRIKNLSLNVNNEYAMDINDAKSKKTVFL
jgi:hypothetical protein